MSGTRSTPHGASRRSTAAVFSRIYLAALTRRLHARRLFGPMHGPGALNHAIASRIAQLRRR
jgi:hypothetical protein